MSAETYACTLGSTRARFGQFLMPKEIRFEAPVQPISADDCLDLRHRVLRPNQPLSACRYPLDEAPGTLHLGYREGDGPILGIASVFHEAPPESSAGNAWRIRGMAVDPAYQGRGFGALLLKGLIDYATAQQNPDDPPGLLWCNGRTTVEPFYVAQGFSRVGDIFDLPPIGPHVVLERVLR